ncbi:magnesium transporter NIPA2 [Populus alba x Populus x berolinensis]|uniref:Probable magnesium transporter n=1 Tax=Populus alba x Populus x berolinensis TaxID=444605 RepID=A0AAD6RVF2_9ROSI|nr:magnesium transporter NIPA2 [Populus alba x Populus x berolinensis]
MGISPDNVHGLVLAVSSSVFIGSSFIVKKKGLLKSGNNGTRAGAGGHSYLYEPWWWAGMIVMIVGEIANFAAYAFAPAILVTPLGALSIIFSAVLAHFILKEKLHIFGVLGCVLCVVGSTSIVLHAPQERAIESVKEVWHLATEPGFLVYSGVVLVVVSVLIFRFAPLYGQKNMIVYVGICSLMGSITVMSVKALGIALKLTFSGSNQFIYYQTWLFTIVVVFACLLQINYLNKALDTFNTAVISPVYYVMFTSLTILASMIMFKEWDSQNASQIVTEVWVLSQSYLGPFSFIEQRTWEMLQIVNLHPKLPSPLRKIPPQVQILKSNKWLYFKHCHGQPFRSLEKFLSSKCKVKLANKKEGMHFSTEINVHAINNMHGYCYLCLMVALFVFFFFFFVLVAFLEESSSIKDVNIVV